MKVPFFRLDASGNELKYIREVLESGWLTSAGKALDFEAAFAEAVGARHALAVNSCTAALHLACETAGVGPGSEVLVPSITFTATAEVAEYLGATVRLIDVDPISGMVDPETLNSALARYPNASCLVPVHLAGLPARMRGTAVAPGLLDICEANGITVIEDAAHAFPSKYDDTMHVGGPIGSLACCFSFYANKTITTGEGGMVVTDDDEVATRIKRMRLHGIDRSAYDRADEQERPWEYDVVAAGYKYNLPDMAAAVGLAQLERAGEFREARARLAERYHERLFGIPGLRMPIADKYNRHSWHLYIIHVDDSAHIDRDAVIRELAQRGISTSVHYKPLHRMSHWATVTGKSPAEFPGAEAWWKSCLTLPLFPGMTTTEHDAVCTAIESIMSKSRSATT